MEDKIEVSLRDASIETSDEIVVYLAGSIRQEYEEFCRTWRREIREYFKDIGGVLVLDPIEGKDLEEEHDPSTIYVQDMYNVMKSDIIFFEMTQYDYPYVGSLIELHEAHENINDIIVWGGRHEDHYFVQHIMENEERYYGWLEAVNALIKKIRDMGDYPEEELPKVDFVHPMNYEVLQTYAKAFMDTLSF